MLGFVIEGQMPKRKQLAAGMTTIQSSATIAREDSSSSSKAEEAGLGQSQDRERERKVNNRLVIPEDGYEWRKYGQKFIKHIGKQRSYFKCQKSSCKAKKRVEWSYLEQGSMRVVYEGVHDDHEHKQTTSSAAAPNNSYDLFAQVFGHDQTSSSSLSAHHRHHHV